MFGWVKLHRSIQSHWLWRDSDKFQAWVYLVLEAQYSASKVSIDNQIVIVNRGQMLTSILRLANEWGWSRKKVSNFLNMLEKDNMLKQKRTSKYTLITIVNYGLYQDEKTEKNINGTSTEHQKNINGTHKKKEKNVKKGEEFYIAPTFLKGGKNDELQESDRTFTDIELYR